MPAQQYSSTNYTNNLILSRLHLVDHILSVDQMGSALDHVKHFGDVWWPVREDRFSRANWGEVDHSCRSVNLYSNIHTCKHIRKGAICSLSTKRRGCIVPASSGELGSLSSMLFWTTRYPADALGMTEHFLCRCSDIVVERSWTYAKLL